MICTCAKAGPSYFAIITDDRQNIVLHPHQGTEKNLRIPAIWNGGGLDFGAAEPLHIHH